MTEVVPLGESVIAFVATTLGPLAEATTFDRFRRRRPDPDHIR